MNQPNYGNCANTAKREKSISAGTVVKCVRSGDRRRLWKDRRGDWMQTTSWCPMHREKGYGE